MAGIALVTGASSGIGAATAEALVDAGYQVIAAGRRVDRLAELADRVGPAMHPLRLDVGESSSAATLVDRLPPELGAVDVLINNAGHDVGGRRRFDEGDLADWEAIIDTNVLGLMRVTHAILPGMLARKRGHVVNVGSVVGRLGYAGGTAYAASKFAVRGFTESLRKDCRGTGVRVSEVAPGLVRTGFAAARWHGDADKAKAFYDGAKDGALAPEDIARVIVFVVTQPAGVTVSEIAVEPSGEPGA
ncbi:MAG: SDR family NAD(P)-dependent oxidoreductase [Alphaproteobacteria bacterium]